GHHALAVALQKFQADDIFEILYPLGSRGRRNIFKRRGTADLLFLDRSQKQAKRQEVDLPDQHVHAKSAHLLESSKAEMAISEISCTGRLTVADGYSPLSSHRARDSYCRSRAVSMRGIRPEIS